MKKSVFYNECLIRTVIWIQGPEPLLLCRWTKMKRITVMQGVILMMSSFIN